MLPPTSDAQLRTALAVIVTAGWGVQLQPRHEDAVRLLLELAPPRGRATYARRAHDMLVAIDASLQEAAEDRDEVEPLLTHEQAIGLRILIGTHPNYRETTARLRRDNAAEYLGESKRGLTTISGASLYKRRQAELLQIVVDCLRRSYPSAPTGPRLYFETEMVTAMVHVDDQRRIASTHYHYIRRARMEGQRRMFLRAELPPAATSATVTAFTGLEFAHMHEYTPGHLSIAFDAPTVVEIGQRQSFGFRLNFAYDDLVTPVHGHFMHWEHTDYFRLNVHVHFNRSIPAACWYFANTMINYPLGPTTADGIVEWEHNVAHVHTSATWARMAHGVAWRWEESEIKK